MFDRPFYYCFKYIHGNSEKGNLNMAVISYSVSTTITRRKTVPIGLCFSTSDTKSRVIHDDFQIVQYEKREPPFGSVLFKYTFGFHVATDIFIEKIQLPPARVARGHLQIVHRTGYRLNLSSKIDLFVAALFSDR